MDYQLQLELTILVIVLILARILYLVHKNTTGFSKKADGVRTSPCKTMICIGSGGHTTEMINLIKSLDLKRYFPRYYIVANSDTTSLLKVKKMESDQNQIPSSYKIIEVPRSRVVNQSYITSVATTIYSTLYCIPYLLKIRPDLILCNGPGTCIPICVIAFLMKVTFISNVRIVFIESFCRTQSLSLSGKILLYIADNFLVQWPGLKKIKQVEYIGKLM